MPNLVSSVNISVVDNPTNITVSTVGVAGATQDLSSLVSDAESGQFYPASNPAQFIRSGDVNNISGELSNRLTNSGQTLYNLINESSGYLKTIITNFSGNSQCFSTGINPTGTDIYYVNYPLGPFLSIPRIFSSIEISGLNMYAVDISGRNSTGFYALFSDNIAESGVILHIFATINN
jgi:hypothetical protein